MKDKEFLNKIKSNRNKSNNKSIIKVIDKLDYCFRNNVYISKIEGGELKSKIESYRGDSITKTDIRNALEIIHLMAFQNIN